MSQYIYFFNTLIFNNKLDSFKLISTAKNALKTARTSKYFSPNGVSSTENLTQFPQYIFAIRQSIFHDLCAAHQRQQRNAKKIDAF